jgi:hypothetical protein
MFRHYRVFLRELVINTLPSYTSISNAAVGNTIYNEDVSHRFYASYANNRGPTGTNLQELQKHQAKVTENECSHLV